MGPPDQTLAPCVGITITKVTEGNDGHEVETTVPKGIEGHERGPTVASGPLRAFVTFAFPFVTFAFPFVTFAIVDSGAAYSTGRAT
jgi:hypothetical protein